MSGEGGSTGSGGFVQGAVRSFVGQIEYFTIGDDAKNYLERMDHLLKFNKISDDEKVSFVIGLCGAELYKIIKSICAPKKPDEMKYTELQKALKGYFDPKVNETGERYKFQSRVRKSEESVSDFIIELKILSETCAFPGSYLEQALRDQLVFGVNNQQIRQKLTFHKACQIAKSMEMTMNDDESMRLNQNETIAAVKDRARKPVFSRLQVKDRSEETRGKGRFANYKCHECKRYGHLARYCRQNQQNGKYAQKGKSVKALDEEEDSDGDHREVNVNYINRVLAKGPVFMEVSINGKTLEMEVDTGASKSVIHIEDKQKYFREIAVNKFSTNLFNVSGRRIDVVGSIGVSVRDSSDENILHKCELVVIEGERKTRPLLGRDIIEKLFLT